MSEWEKIAQMNGISSPHFYLLVLIALLARNLEHSIWVNKMFMCYYWDDGALKASMQAGTLPLIVFHHYQSSTTFTFFFCFQSQFCDYCIISAPFWQQRSKFMNRLGKSHTGVHKLLKFFTWFPLQIANMLPEINTCAFDVSNSLLLHILEYFAVMYIMEL